MSHRRTVQQRAAPLMAKRTVINISVLKLAGYSHSEFPIMVGHSNTPWQNNICSLYLYVRVTSQIWFGWRRQCHMFTSTDGAVPSVVTISHSVVFPCIIIRDFLKSGFHQHFELSNWHLTAFLTEISVVAPYQYFIVFKSQHVQITGFYDQMSSFSTLSWNPKFMHIFHDTLHFWQHTDLTTRSKTAGENIKEWIHFFLSFH